MTEENYRILVVDDTPSIHEDFRKILLAESKSARQCLEDINKLLLGEKVAKPKPSTLPPFTIDSAFQSQEAIALVERSLKHKKPYAMAYVDVVMPPGDDGIATVKRIWELDPEIQTVICTAYAKYTSEDIMRILGTTDRLFILKKPFDSIESVQLAISLTKKWNLNHLLAEKMAEFKKLPSDSKAPPAMTQALSNLKQALAVLKNVHKEN